MKTFEAWNNSGLDLTEFVKPGDEIDYEIYEHIGYALVSPNYDDGKTLQCGECSFKRDGVNYFMTAEEKDGKYFYLGELPDKNMPVKRIKLSSPKSKPLQVGDPVVVMDPGLIMLQRFAPPNAKPNNEGTVLEIYNGPYGKMILVDFPIGDDDPKEHSQAAPYPAHLVKLKPHERNY